MAHLMKNKSQRDNIRVWRIPELRDAELHRGTSVSRYCPRHWHDEFHLCLIQAGGGELIYRGATHRTPTGSLFIVHPGEVHANQTYDAEGCSYRNLYLNPGMLQDAAKEVGIRDIPFFREAVFFDTRLIRSYVTLHCTLERLAPRLEQESLLLSLLVRLVTRHAGNNSALKLAGKERTAVRRARDYLTDNYAENVSLERLSSVACLSPFYLSRVFCAELGLPPHAFQTQVRVNQAKRLLCQGLSAAAVASETGFADQSHLTRHFKRLVGVPPGEYVKRAQPGVGE